MNYMTVSPAYGRDYKSKAAVLKDWRAGKDFVIESIGPDMGRYISIGDAPKGTTIMIRYANLSKVCEAN